MQYNRLTRVTLPVKVLLGLAVAAKVQPCLLTGWAVSKWHVVVGNLVPEVDLLLLQHDRSSNGVDWCITPPFIEETTIMVQRGEEVNVFLGSQPVQVANLKVRPLERVGK